MFCETNGSGRGFENLQSKRMRGIDCFLIGEQPAEIEIDLREQIVIDARRGRGPRFDAGTPQQLGVRRRS
jgi:hypothetical protein